MYPLNGRSVGLSVCLSVEKMYIPGARKKTIWVFFLKITDIVAWYIFI